MRLISSINFIVKLLYFIFKLLLGVGIFERAGSAASCMPTYPHGYWVGGSVGYHVGDLASLQLPTCPWVVGRV